MRIGVYSDSLPNLNRRDMFAWCATRGIHDVELGVGAWGPWPRPHLDLATIGEAGERDKLGGELREFGVRLSAVNAAGNLLHPNPVKRADAQARLKAAVDLAVVMKVDRVITMSGCPAGPGGGALGVFPCWATSCDDERLFDWQLENEVGPYWRATSSWLKSYAPGVKICFELHPGVTIFTAAGFKALKPYLGDNIGINLDPSHFWWQGIDPETVVEDLGPHIGFAHGKDTLLYPDRIRRFGTLHYNPPTDAGSAPWHFAPVGEGHDIASWVKLLKAMQSAGYDGVVSIEHEDPRYIGEEGTQRSFDGLKLALAAMGVGR